MRLSFVIAPAFFAIWIPMLPLGTSQTQRQATNRSTSLSSVVSGAGREDAFSGAVLVAEGDARVLEKGFGMADAEWAIPNGPDVKYRLGSLTKQFTAALILLLVEDGKVSLSASVTKYLPGMPKAWDQITIAELLGNTSGIPDFTRAPSFQEWL